MRRASTRRSCVSRASTCQALIADGKTVKILCVGRKGHDQLRRHYGKQIIDTRRAARRAHASASSNAEEIAQKVAGAVRAGEFDVARCSISRFKSVIAQIPTAQQIIPAESSGRRPTGARRRSYEYEPDEDEILAELLPRNISVQVFRALLENAASEQGAQMTAMDNATRNAGDMINKLTLNYNRTRQAKITKELIEIISGAEAL